MTKVTLRLLVIIAIVVVSVAITTAILHKPNYNTIVYKTWQSASQESRYDLDQKINQTLISNSASFDGKTLKEKESKISNIASLGQAIEDYITYLAKQTKFSSSVSEKDAKKIKKQLNEYYDLMLDNDSTGYWVDYYYDYVQNQNFDSTNTVVYNQVIQTLEAKWLVQAIAGSELLKSLQEFATKYCYKNAFPTDLKTTLLQFTATFASVYVNSENYSAFEVNHLAEFKNLITNVANKLNHSPINYSNNELILTETYSTLTTEEIKNFIESTNKTTFINGITDAKKASAFNILNSYVEEQ